MKTYDRDSHIERSAALLAASALLVSLSLPGTALADSQKKKSGANDAPPDAKVLVHKMIENEIKAENDDSTHWRFSKTSAKPGLTKTYRSGERRVGKECRSRW